MLPETWVPMGRRGGQGIRQRIRQGNRVGKADCRFRDGIRGRGEGAGEGGVGWVLEAIVGGRLDGSPCLRYAQPLATCSHWQIEPP